MVIVYLHYSHRHRPLNQQVYWAARDGRTEEVVRLLGEGADPNWQDMSGWTALHVACIYNHHQVLTVLVNSEHTNINIKDRDKDTLLHYACREGSFECVRVLVVANCDSG